MAAFFSAVFYQPLYNGLILLFNLIPGGDMGIAVILFTLIIKLILFPLSQKAVKTQLGMKRLEPEFAKIREKYPDKQEQALKTMELYKVAGVNPFASFFLVIIQLPILIALYYTFVRSGLPTINTSLLYPFVHANKVISMQLFGLVDISSKNAILSLLAALSTYLQIRFSGATLPPKAPGSKASFSDDLARTMNMQMRYIYPVIVFIISYRISGAVALYWLVTNLITALQELYVRRSYARKQQALPPSVS
jgi:YidC/Oxa1 family membrane protein insertase